MNCLARTVHTLLLLLTLGGALSAAAQSTAFTYQGRLKDAGAPANGLYDLRFTLYDADTAGNTVGSPVTSAPVTASNGVFATSLDFGASAFDGSARWIELAVRPNGSVGAYTVQSPRIAVVSVPYAIRAATATTATTATNLVGNISAAQLPAAAVTNGASEVNISGTFTGNGAGLTNTVTAANYVSTSGTGAQFVSGSGIDVYIFNSDSQINGWGHTAGTSSFTNLQTGLYLVTYTIGGRNVGGSPEVFTFALVNGNEAPGSRSINTYDSGGRYYSQSKSFIGSFVAGDILRISASVPGGAVDFFGLYSSLTIVRIK